MTLPALEATEETPPKKREDPVTIDPHKLRPAVANALWRGLQAKAWLSDYASNSVRPLPPGQIKTTTPPPETSEPPRWEPVNQRLFAFASRSSSRLNFAFTATLLKEDHDWLLDGLRFEYRRSYTEAIELATCERPFLRDAERPTGWKVNYREDMLTPHAVRVLILLASLAIVDTISPEVEAALIGT